jgi:hypothetical protein
MLSALKKWQDPSMPEEYWNEWWSENSMELEYYHLPAFIDAYENRELGIPDPQTRMKYALSTFSEYPQYPEFSQLLRVNNPEIMTWLVKNNKISCSDYLVYASTPTTTFFWAKIWHQARNSLTPSLMKQALERLKEAIAEYNSSVSAQSSASNTNLEQKLIDFAKRFDRAADDFNLRRTKNRSDGEVFLRHWVDKFIAMKVPFVRMNHIESIKKLSIYHKLIEVKQLAFPRVFESKATPYFLLRNFRQQEEEGWATPTYQDYPEVQETAKWSRDIVKQCEGIFTEIEDLLSH